MDQNIKLRPQGSFAMTSRGDTIFSEAKDLVGPGGRMNYWKSEVVNPCDGDQKYYGGQIEVAGHVQKMGQDKEYICHDSDDYKVKIKKEDREGLILPEIPPNATVCFCEFLFVKQIGRFFLYHLILLCIIVSLLLAFLLKDEHKCMQSWSWQGKN